MGRWSEDWSPLAAASADAILLGMVVHFRGVTIPADFTVLVAVSIEVAAIAIGFLATAQTILLSLEHRPMIRMLRASGDFDRLIVLSLRAIHWCFGVIVLSAAVLLIDMLQVSAQLLPYSIAFWSASILGGFVACFTVLRIFGIVLRDEKRWESPPGTRPDL
jgi:hypothetical protein